MSRNTVPSRTPFDIHGAGFVWENNFTREEAKLLCLIASVPVENAVKLWDGIAVADRARLVMAMHSVVKLGAVCAEALLLEADAQGVRVRR